MATKPNDWIATILYQPNMSLDDLNTVGVTPDNTSLKDKDYYMGLDAVKEAFTDKDGKFKEADFNTFYDSAQLLYNQYADKLAASEVEKNYTYDPFDWRYDGKTSDVQSTITFDKNPMMESDNIKALGIHTTSPFSIREIAQTERVFNYETGQFEDWTPNDKGGLLEGLLRPTLVLATWDEDGIHQDETGRTIEHKKGDYKYHPITGKPYYETIGNREIYNKDVLHVMDTFTEDGSKINKFDFFDSDGLDKSITGSIAKLTANIAPMALGLVAPELGLVYGGISAAVAFSQVIPTVGKAINGFATNNNSNAVGKKLNDWEAWTARFGKTVSDRSREKIITVENASSLVSDVAKQLFQQRSVQFIPRLFKNNPKIYNNAKLARTLSYAYMSGTSALESYADFKRAGANDRVAGLGMIATMAGFYKLMSIDYFRDSFFKGSWFDDNNVKSPVWNVAEDFMNAIKNEGSQVAKDAASETVAASRRTLRTLYNSFVDKIQRVGKAWRPMPFWERAFAEGAEEVMEEGMQDSIKAFFKGVEAIGIPVSSNDQKLDFGFSWEDALQRYGMSFAGGFVGGAIFQGYNNLEQKLNGASATANTPDAHLSELVKLVADGRGEEIKSLVKNWHDKKRFGSNVLSATKLSTVTSPSGDTIVASEKGADDISQNDLIYQSLLAQVDYVQKVLSEEKFTDISGTLAEAVKLANPSLTKEEANSKAAADTVTMLGLHSLVLKDLQRLAEKITKVRSQIDTRLSSFKPANDTNEAKEEAKQKADNDPNIKALKKRLEDLRKDRDDIYNGKRIEYYVSQYALSLNKKPLAPFLGFSDLNDFVRLNYGCNIADLSAVELELAKEDFKTYTDGSKSDLFSAIDVYRALANQFSEDINNSEKELAKSVSDPDLQTRTIGNVYFEKVNELEKLNKRLEELNNKESLTEEEEAEKSKIDADKKKLESELKAIRNNPSSTLSNVTENREALIEKITQLFNENVSDIGDETIGSIADELKSTYREWVSKNILKRSHAELDAFYSLIRRKSTTKQERATAIENWINAINENGNENSEDSFSKLFERIEGRPYKTADNTNPELFDETGHYIRDHFLNWDGIHKRPSQVQFESLITQFWSDLGKPESVLLDDYNKIVEFLKGYGLTDNEIKDLLYHDIGSGQSLLPWIGSQPIHEFLSEISELKSKVKQSILPKLLASYSAKLSDTETASLFELIDGEQRRISSLSNLDKYLMSPQMAANLKEALVLLEGLKGLVLGASDGTNAKINEYRANNKFAEISKTTADMLTNDLDEYINRIKFLLKLNEYNGGMKLSEHKDIAVNMHIKFLSKLIDAIHVGRIDDQFGTNIEKIVLDSKLRDTLNDITVDTFSTYEKQIIDLETKIRAEIKALDLSNEQVAEKVFEVYKSEDIWKQKSSRITKDSDEEVTDFDSMLYTLGVFLVNSNNFHKKLHDIVEEKFEKAPVYGHELAVRTAYSMTLHTDAFNKILDLIQKSYTGTDDYVKNRRILHNILFGFGGAGTGKTTSIVALYKEMVSDLDVSVVLMSSGKTQLNTLSEVTGITDDSQKVQYDTFFEKIGGSDINTIQEEVDGHIVSKDIRPFNYPDILNASARKTILICDEIETLNEKQLYYLSKFAENNGSFVLAIGDPKQPTPIVKIVSDKGKIERKASGIEDCIYIKSAMLTASLRTISSAKNDNYNILDNILNTVNEAIEDDTEKYLIPENRATLINSLIGAGIDLKFYENGNILVGDRIIKDETEFKERLDKAISLANDKNKVLIVTDDLTKYQADKYKDNDNVVIATIDEALGGEYGFAFIDADLNTELDGGYSALQKLYMLSQRSKLYSAVLDKNDLFKSMRITSSNDPKANTLLSIAAPQIKEYKDWRLKGISGLIYDDTDADEIKSFAGTPPPPSGPEPTSSAPAASTPAAPAPAKPASSGSAVTPASVPAVPSVPAVSTSNPVSTPAPTTPVESPTVGTSGKPDEIPEPVSTSGQSVAPYIPKKVNNAPIKEVSKPEKTSEETPAEETSGEKIVMTTKFEEVAKLDRDYEKISAYIGPELTSNTLFEEWYNDLYENDSFYSSQINGGESISSIVKVQDGHNTRNMSKTQLQTLLYDIHLVIFGAEDLNTATDRLKTLLKSNKYVNYKRNDILNLLENGIKQIVINNKNIILQLKSADEKQTVNIPIGKTNIERNGIYTGWFKQVSRTSFENEVKNGKNVFITIGELKKKYPWLRICDTAGIFVKDKLAGVNKDFGERNNGKTFIVAGEMLGDLDPTLIFKGATTSNGTWTYSYSDKLALVGIQRRLDADQLKRFLVLTNYMKFGLTKDTHKRQSEFIYSMLRSLGYLNDLKIDFNEATIDKIRRNVNIDKVRSDLTNLGTGNWSDFIPGSNWKDDLFGDYISCGTPLGTVIANLLSNVLDNPSDFTNGDTYHILRQGLAGTKDQRFFIKTKDGKLYAIWAEREYNDTLKYDIPKRLVISEWDNTKPAGQDLGKELASMNYEESGTGEKLGSSLRKLFEDAKLKDKLSGAIAGMVVFKQENNQIGYWNANNANETLYRLLAPYMDPNKTGAFSFESVIGSLKYGFYGNIKGTDPKLDNCAWNFVSLVGNESLYSTDAVIWHPATYNVDENQLLDIDTPTVKIDILNAYKEYKPSIVKVASKLISEDVVNQILELYENDINACENWTQFNNVINKVIDEINNNILSETTSQNTVLLTYNPDDGTFPRKNEDTTTIAINNGLTRLGIDVESYETLCNDNGIAVFTDGKISAYCYINEASNEVVVKRTSLAQEIADIINNIDELVPNNYDPRYDNENFRHVERDKSILKHYIQNMLNENGRNACSDDEIRVILGYENARTKICNYLEKRLNSDIDEC